MGKSIKIAYLGQVAPFDPEFVEQPGYGRAGTLAQLGFIEALQASKTGLDCAWGFRPISHWPKAKIKFERMRRLVLPCGAKLTLFPLVNHFFIREISRYFIIACSLIAWTVSRFGYKRVLVVYNLTHPNGVVWLRLLTWLMHIRLVPIVYDMAQITTFRKSFLFRLLEPDWLDRAHERFIPLCDGLMPITDAIARDFAPQLRYLRVDGGVGEAVISRLPPIELRHGGDEFVLFYAGALEKWNSIDTLLDVMSVDDNPRLRLWIAGGGSEESLVRDRVASDPRIVYLGYLDPDELYRRYGEADVLINLRCITDPGLRYHYPSKTFEMLAMGRPLIISNSAHTKECYGKYCKVIDECDVQSLFTAIVFFMRMTPEERMDYGKRAREYILGLRRWCKWGLAIGEYLESL